MSNSIFQNREKYQYVHEVQTIQSLMTLINDKSINLDTTYQRNVVWDNNNKPEFIRSIFRCISPNPIILNCCSDNDKMNCIDGKQRLSTLKEFMENRFGVLYTDELNGITEEIYYDKIPKPDDTKNCRILLPPEKNCFKFTTLSVTRYNNLSYDQEIEIFQAIQNGKALTTGEMISSYFSEDKIQKEFSVMSQKFYDLYLKKYFTQEQGKRKKHDDLNTIFMFILDSSKPYPPTKKEKAYFVNNLKMPKMKALGNRLESIYKKIFNKEILYCKSKINIMYVLVHLYDTFVLAQNFINNSKNNKECRNIIKSTIYHCNTTKKIKQTNTDIDFTVAYFKEKFAEADDELENEENEENDITELSGEDSESETENLLDEDEEEIESEQESIETICKKEKSNIEKELYTALPAIKTKPCKSAISTSSSATPKKVIQQKWLPKK